MSTKNMFLNFSDLVCKGPPRCPPVFYSTMMHSKLPTLNPGNFRASYPLLNPLQPLTQVNRLHSPAVLSRTCVSWTFPSSNTSAPNPSTVPSLHKKTAKPPLCVWQQWIKGPREDRKKMCFLWFSQHLGKAKSISAYCRRCLSDKGRLQFWLIFLHKTFSQQCKSLAWQKARLLRQRFVLLPHWVSLTGTLSGLYGTS